MKKPWYKSKKFLTLIVGASTLIINDPFPFRQDTLLAFVGLLAVYIGVEGSIDAASARKAFSNAENVQAGGDVKVNP